jgi:hypothetical protein
MAKAKAQMKAAGHDRHYDACRAMFQVIWTQWGTGWKYLGDDIKRAIVAERVLYCFLGQLDEPPIKTATMQAYLDAMLFYCGLSDDEGSD